MRPATAARSPSFIVHVKLVMPDHPAGSGVAVALSPRSNSSPFDDSNVALAFAEIRT